MFVFFSIVDLDKVTTPFETFVRSLEEGLLIMAEYVLIFCC